MIQLDIKVVTVRKFTHYRSKQAVNSEFKNLVNQHFSAEKRLSDITYIHTVKHGWTYLAIVINAFAKAKSKRDITENMIFHSDLGSQYTSNEYEKLLTENKVKHSYSKKVILMIMQVWRASMPY